MYFTSNIRILRKRKGRTQDEAAIALNLKRSTLSGYENGIAQPGIDVLVSFSKYFNISIDTLLKVDLHPLGSVQQLDEVAEEHRTDTPKVHGTSQDPDRRS